MSNFGLECFDASGGKTLSISDRITRFHSSFQLNFPDADRLNWRFHPIPGFSGDGTWVVTLSAYSIAVKYEEGGLWLMNQGSGQTCDFVVFRC